MVTLTRHSDESLGPLARALAPPAGETPEQRAVRERKETEARRISERIDEQIRLEKQAHSRKKIPVKVLMLGQAESGAFAFLPNSRHRGTELNRARGMPAPPLCREVHDGKKSFRFHTLHDLDMCSTGLLAPSPQSSK